MARTPESAPTAAGETRAISPCVHRQLNGVDTVVRMITEPYPGWGYVVNRQCDEVIWASDGRGVAIAKNAATYTLGQGDFLVIPKGTAFRYDSASANGMRMYVMNVPKFTPGQHELVGP